MSLTHEEKTSLVAELEALKEELSSQEWWSSRKVPERDRRYAAESWIGYLKQYVELDQISVGFVTKHIALLRNPEIEWESVLVGQSVGFKKPKKRGLTWVDVPGIADPAEASRMVAESRVGRQLVAEGFREYGISPMKDRQKKSAAAVEAAVSASTFAP
jgi:hypothetical protein